MPNEGPFSIGTVRVQLDTFSTSELGGGDWSASCSGHFTCVERAPVTHWIGWVDIAVNLDVVASLSLSEITIVI
jgi:hypothetical protein